MDPKASVLPTTPQRLTRCHYKHCAMLSEFRDSIGRMPNRKYLIVQLESQIESATKPEMPQSSVSIDEIESKFHRLYQGFGTPRDVTGIQ